MSERERAGYEREAARISVALGHHVTAECLKAIIEREMAWPVGLAPLPPISGDWKLRAL